ncbi:MAG: sulfur carrier protein ThiS [Pirellulales bacterium]|nr:sulfur carrier protein ThiS [Pirellulales bacterium]
MQIELNGENREAPEGITVADLLEVLKLAGKPVAVEVNRELVIKARHAEHHLAPGDRVEVVSLVGGG